MGTTCGGLGAWGGPSNGHLTRSGDAGQGAVGGAEMVALTFAPLWAHPPGTSLATPTRVTLSRGQGAAPRSDGCLSSPLRRLEWAHPLSPLPYMRDAEQGAEGGPEGGVSIFAQSIMGSPTEAPHLRHALRARDAEQGAVDGAAES